jgi:phosphoribosylformimino-5-aminoimidazole carboxamide ribotide isomerase
VIAIPAVGLRAGACIPLDDGQRVAVGDPVAVARGFAQQGFRRMHVIDLDAALDCGSNERVIHDILHEVDIELQVGGGVRTEDQIARLLGDGIAHVVIGTRALADRWWLEDIAARFAGAIIVAADVCERRIVTRGWTPVTSRLLLDAVDDFNLLELAGVLVTAVDSSGHVLSANLPLMEDVAAQSDVPLFAGGRIESVRDLRALEERGVAACLLGAPTDRDTMELRAILDDFGE